MTEDDKKLLLTDLSARLPYGVISDRPSGNAKITEIRFDEEYNSFVCYSSNGFGGDISFEKPYLRSMSSMTEEETIKYITLTHYNTDDSGKPYRELTIEALDWLNAHHFDYRGLIEKGLALEAPKEMYNIGNIEALVTEEIYIDEVKPKLKMETTQKNRNVSPLLYGVIDSKKREAFLKRLEELYNTLGIDTELNTPDYLLAEYTLNCLVSYGNAVTKNIEKGLAYEAPEGMYNI